MTLRRFKPVTAGRRGKVSVIRKGLHTGKPFAPLLAAKKRTSGRNNQGRITVRHRGGGHKRKYRIIDFKRLKDSIEARVERFEYDPNRSATVALLLYDDGERRYIIAPDNLKVGDRVVSGESVPMNIGNAMPLENMLIGSVVHCVELKPLKGAQLARSAGAMAQYQALEAGYATLRLRSGEIRKVHAKCRATIGSVGAGDHALAKLGKAGAKRHLGVRPTVRGVAMNPIDHPHGGGEGKTSGGRHPVSPWGQSAKGLRTSKRSSFSASLLIKHRNSK